MSGPSRKRTCADDAGTSSPKVSRGGRLNSTSTSVAVTGRHLAGADVDRHALPAPAFDEQLHRDEGLDIGIRRYARELGGSRRTARARPAAGRAGRTHFSSAAFWSRCASCSSPGRRVHRQMRQHLQKVVLQHVPVGAGFVVEAPAILHAEILGHGDLDAADVVAVPQRLEHRIGEARVEQVLHRLLAQEVVDAEDVLFREVASAACRSASSPRRGRGRTASRSPAARRGRSRISPGRPRRWRTGWAAPPDNAADASPRPARHAGRENVSPDRHSRHRHSAAATAASAPPCWSFRP